MLLVADTEIMPAIKIFSFFVHLFILFFLLCIQQNEIMITKRVTQNLVKNSLKPMKYIKHNQN